MKAAFYQRTGSAAEVLEIAELPTPSAGPGEVRVKLLASGINPSDIKSRSGTTGRSSGVPTVIPHSDGAGVIDQVGDGVAAGRIGERVWVYNGQWQRNAGTAAQYIALPAAQAVPLPDNTSFEAGACLGIPALTAWVAVEHTHCGPGETVVIQGGAGAVGRYAIQFARARGAQVIATVSSAQKAAHARAAGANHTVDYRDEEVVARVRELTGQRGADAIVEVNFSANVDTDIAMLASHGRIAVYGAASDRAELPLRQLRGLNAALRFMRVYDTPPALRERAILAIGTLLEDGHLSHQIAHRYPLDEIAAAHDAVDGGALIGNVVLDIPQD